MIYTATTQNLRVDVIPSYLEAESKIEEGFYVWSYLVTIHNLGTTEVQLLNRHWEITDERGMRQIVDGEGVIGQQPIIAPGSFHRYSSWTWLRTPSGFMTGHYEMSDLKNNVFNIAIPAFSLDSPAMMERAN